jgi:cytochrome c oxidase cbb3-type subunit I
MSEVRAQDSPLAPPPGPGITAPDAVDSSSRWAILLLFWAGTKWLVLATLLGLLVGLKFHTPNLLADAAWLTYGRLQPAFWNVLLYGFAWQTGLGAALWLLVRLGRTPVAYPLAALAGLGLWNLGLVIGLVGILSGDSTGHPWLEIPGYGSILLLVAYGLIALSALGTFSRRQPLELHPSQWFLLAALFWFPWIYSTAQLLLVADPVRGVFQAVVAWWFGAQFLWGCLAFVGLAVLWYLLPALLERPLHSRYHALFAFWLLVLFTGWRGIPNSAPVPAWLPSVSTVFAVLCVVSLLAVALNLHRTVAGSYRKVWQQPALALAVFGAGAYLLATALGILQTLPSMSRVTDLTLFTPGVQGLFVYGFLGGTLLALNRHVVPRWLPESAAVWPRASWPIWVYLAGALLHALPLILGGWAQGMALNDPALLWTDAFQPALMALRFSTLGDLLLLVGVSAHAWGFGGVLLRFVWRRTQPVLVSALKPEPIEVGS